MQVALARISCEGKKYGSRSICSLNHSTWSQPVSEHEPVGLSACPSYLEPIEPDLARALARVSRSHGVLLFSLNREGLGVSGWREETCDVRCEEICCWVVSANNIKSQECWPQWAQLSQAGEMPWYHNLCHQMAWHSMSLLQKN